MSTKQNTTNTNTNTTAIATSNASEAIRADFAPIAYTAKSAAIADTVARYNAIATNVGTAIGNTKAIIAEAKKQAANIFYGWNKTEAHKLEGYKSFSEMIDAMGLNKSAVLAAVRYADANHTYDNAFADMTIDNYAKINSALKANADRVMADKKNGVLDGKTQAELGEYAARVIAETPTTKSGKVVTLYHATTADGKEIDEPRTLAEWKIYYNADNYQTVLLNKISIENGCVYAIVPLDFSKSPFLMFCRKTITESADKKAKEFRATTIKLAWNAKHSIDGVNAVLDNLGYEPLTDKERAALA